MLQTSIKELMNRFPRPGTLVAIGIRPERLAPVVAVEAVRIEPGHGLSGDRFRGRPDSKRQVTLIQSEHVAAIASCLGLGAMDALQFRRNLVVSGINLLALKGQRFQVGSAVLEYTGPCEPCSRMEELLGPGGYNAMRGHGGITARVLTAGEAKVGDSVTVIAPLESYIGQASAP